MGKRAKLPYAFELKKCQNSRHLRPELKNSQARDDRISELPDEILVFVLSLLTLKEAAQTSVLSSRWMNLWKCTSRLDFYDPKSLDRIAEKGKRIKRERSKYVHWVNRVLDVHKGSLVEFKLDFELGSSYQDEIDKWLEYALRRNLKELELKFFQEWPRHPSECYNFPDHLLNLKDSRLPKLIAFGSLRVLSLQSVNVTGEVIEYFLQNCHYLERLVVVASECLVNLQVSGPSLVLKHLKIKRCSNVRSFKISDCGRLVSLSITELEGLMIMNVPMLSKLSIGTSRPGFLSLVLSKVSPLASQLECLKLRALYPSNLLELDEFPQLSQLKELVIRSSAWDDDSLMGLISWIKASPSLQKFGLKLWWMKPLKIVRDNEKGAKCTLKHLREIELGGYYGRTSDVELLMYLIENAVALEKIIIRPQCQIRSRIPDRMSKKKQNAVTRALEEVKQMVPKHVELVIL